MNETANKNAFFHGLRQSLVVAFILLLLCGFVFPVLLNGISAVIFPRQANGSLVYADGQAVGAVNIRQDFTKPYFMKGRPSAYHYNTYYEDEQGNQYYNDGSAFAGVSSGSNNYAASNRALTERVEADFFEVDLEEGDPILLCSDGLTNMVDDGTIARIASGGECVRARAEKLVNQANENGGRDNITVILADYEKEVG